MGRRQDLHRGSEDTYGVPRARAVRVSSRSWSRRCVARWIPARPGPKAKKKGQVWSPELEVREPYSDDMKGVQQCACDCFTYLGVQQQAWGRGSTQDFRAMEDEQIELFRLWVALRTATSGAAT